MESSRLIFEEGLDASTWLLIWNIKLFLKCQDQLYPHRHGMACSKKLKKLNANFEVDIIQKRASEKKNTYFCKMRLFYHSENGHINCVPSAPRFGGDCFIFTVSPAMGMVLYSLWIVLVSVTFRALICSTYVNCCNFPDETTIRFPDAAT